MIIGEKLDLHNNPKRLLPNVYLHQAFNASRELLGNDGFVAVMKRADTILPGMGRYLDEENWPPADTELLVPARHYSAFFQAIEEVGGGRAQMVTIGIRTAQMGFEGLGPAMKATLSVLKRLPGFRWRAETVLKAMADDLMDVFPGDREKQAIRVETDDERRLFLFIDRTGDSCHGRNGAHSPICHVYRGAIIGAVKLATGKIPNVRESACMAAGDDACVFEVGFDAEETDET
ncbi:MAG: 4-vinyl reductase [Deltaproteobacteria bacterium]|nr:4-vinyl reductase [Candidatus Zymogenaceae bacterium]